MWWYRYRIWTLARRRRPTPRAAPAPPPLAPLPSRPPPLAPTPGFRSGRGPSPRPWSPLCSGPIPPEWHVETEGVVRPPAPRYHAAVPSWERPFSCPPPRVVLLPVAPGLSPGLPATGRPQPTMAVRTPALAFSLVGRLVNLSPGHFPCDLFLLLRLPVLCGLSLLSLRSLFL